MRTPRTTDARKSTLGRGRRVAAIALAGSLIFAACGLAILWLVAALLREQRLRRAWQTLVQRLLELWNRSHAPPDDP